MKYTPKRYNRHPKETGWKIAFVVIALFIAFTLVGGL